MCSSDLEIWEDQIIDGINPKIWEEGNNHPDCSENPEIWDDYPPDEDDLKMDVDVPVSQPCPDPGSELSGTRSLPAEELSLASHCEHRTIHMPACYVTRAYSQAQYY